MDIGIVDSKSSMFLRSERGKADAYLRRQDGLCPWRLAHMMTPATIFVVDDDPAVRKSLTRVLTSAGYTVETFASAGNFLARGPCVGPSCVVLDVRMPGLNGLELQETLARSTHRRPIVFMTGYADIRPSVTAMKRGASISSSSRSTSRISWTPSTGPWRRTSRIWTKKPGPRTCARVSTS